MCNYFHSLFDSLRLHNYNLKSEVKGIKISVDRIVSCDFNTLIWWCSFSQALSELVLIFIASCLSFMYLTEADDPLQKKKKKLKLIFFFLSEQLEIYMEILSKLDMHLKWLVCWALMVKTCGLVAKMYVCCLSKWIAVSFSLNHQCLLSLVK